MAQAKAQGGLPAEALAAAVETLGGQAAVARLVGVSQPSVWGWIKRSKHLPGEHVLTVEEALQKLGSTITRHDLRPDLYRRDKVQDGSASAIILEPAR